MDGGGRNGGVVAVSGIKLSIIILRTFAGSFSKKRGNVTSAIAATSLSVSGAGRDAYDTTLKI